MKITCPDVPGGHFSGGGSADTGYKSYLTESAALSAVIKSGSFVMTKQVVQGAAEDDLGPISCTVRSGMGDGSETSATGVSPTLTRTTPVQGKYLNANTNTPTARANASAAGPVAVASQSEIYGYQAATNMLHT